MRKRFLKFYVMLMVILTILQITVANACTHQTVTGVCAQGTNIACLANMMSDFTNDYKWTFVTLVFSFVLLMIILFLVIRIRNMKKQKNKDDMVDTETGMGNLQFFKYRFNSITDEFSQKQYYISYIVIDSSYLRSYHGGSSFDNVLKYSASVLSDNVGEDEFAARITENGFAFVFKCESDKDAKKRLKEIMEKLNRFESNSEYNNVIVFHSAVYHLNSSDIDCEILLFNLRKNCNKIFGTDKQIVICDIYSMNKIREEKRFADSILKGLDNNEFRMYLQFVVGNKNKNIISAEALSRWVNNENGVVGPGKYIEDMENSGLISKHDFYMFEQACKQLEKWSGTEFDDISISCNFTRITLSEEDFIDTIEKMCQKYKFDKSKLSIEITEDAIEKDMDIATENVRKCKKLGFKIYLDDLGSGYTSLSNLCDYPIDVVKIDRDILLRGDTERGRELFKGIIALAHSLNIKVICEGVETEEQNTFVSETDCDCIQGWYYSKPIPQEEYEEFIKDHSLKVG
ncbi:MAG: GGDEF domain-containing protein [Clostridia bacterium]|nr:GGDEF domain-containing protein [Clostridia bacterium]